MKTIYTLILVLLASAACGQQTSPNKSLVIATPDYSKSQILKGF